MHEDNITRLDEHLRELGKTAKKLEGSELADLMNDILRKGLHPHVEAIAKIWADNRIAVVMYGVSPEVRPLAVDFGWDGESPVFELPPKWANALARADHVTEAWVRRKGPGRVFFLVHSGNLLLNLTEDGWAPEPGSTTTELSQ